MVTPSIEALLDANTLSGNYACIVCNMKFCGETNLLNHLKHHRDNYFFCRLNCGAKFRHLSQCVCHEYYEQKINNTPNNLVRTLLD